MTEGADSPILLIDRSAGVATLRLNRPSARNALSVALMSALEEALADLAGEPEIRSVILSAEGPAFCAGHDLKEMKEHGERDFHERLFVQCSRVMTAIVRLPQPVIAAVHATATAAGCQLVASCDLAIAGASARFATPGVNIGLFCSTPMVALSRTVARKHAMEMLLTGEMVSAHRAAEIGLVNRVVPDADLSAEVSGVAARIASKSGRVLKIGKEAFYRQLEMDLDSAYRYTSEVMTENRMTPDAEEGIGAFLEKRAPTWPEN